MEEEAEDQVCSRCGMPALVLHNGLLVCEACGTQAEVLTLPCHSLLPRNIIRLMLKLFIACVAGLCGGNSRISGWC